MIGNFDDEAQNILNNAKIEMNNLGHPYVGTEHLLLSILNSDNDIVNRLNEYDLTYNSFKSELCKVVGVTEKKAEFFLYTPLLRKVISSSIIDAKENNNGEVTTEHLFFAMLEEGEGIAIRILIGMGIDIESMYDDFSISLVKGSKKNKKKKLLICDLGTDLTNMAKNNELDPVIGRDKVVRRVMEILCRRTKNNPILIGEAGVGKTAIVEELARLIANDDVPNLLMGKKVISLDMATMVAGTKYRGEFEERMKKVIKEIEDNDDIILFIDEIHTLVGAGGAEGAIDASNILKPALARGKIRCIGATTTSEYKKFIENDSALERRFQKVVVEEPSTLETRNILIKLKPIYEKYHNVILSDNMIDTIIDLSERYVFDRNRPDKEIDILDEVSSRVGIKECTNISEINSIKRKLDKLKKEKNGYIIDNNIDKAYEIRKNETKLMALLNEMELNNKKTRNEVVFDDIASVISDRTGVPIDELTDFNGTSVNNMSLVLHSNIIGQDKAIDSLIATTKKIKMGYRDKCYSFFFVGPSGVGKTEMAKRYASLLVGEDNFIRLDMSEYSDATSVNKILGSSPGYVGYDDNRNFLEEVRNKPNCVILLDEIDKAHPNVINLFYQILEEGKIKNAKGVTVRFDNAIIIMTSNSGFERNGIGFNGSNSDNVISGLKCYFNLAFINRLDNVITFNKLGKNDIRYIINNRLDYIRDKYCNIDIVLSDNIIDDIIIKSEYEEFGARKVLRIISKYIENVVIDAIINNNKEIVINSLDNKNNITI